MPEFPELKDIVDRPEPIDYTPWIILAVVLLIVVVVVAVVLIRMIARRPRLPEFPLIANARQTALADLEAIRARSGEIGSEEALERVQRILRTFLHRQYGALGLYRTADELVGRQFQAAKAPPRNPHLAPVESALRRCEELAYSANPQDIAGEEGRIDLIDEAITSISKMAMSPEDGGKIQPEGSE